MNKTERLSKIKLVITDVDGVLTDNGLYYTADGLVMKKFHVKDGMGVVLLRKMGIKTAIISTDESSIIKKRAERLKMDFVYTGTWEKDLKLKEICEILNISAEETAFIGDDVNDIGIIKVAGVTACPADAMPEIKSMVDFVLPQNGGCGVFREFADMILDAKNKKGQPNSD
jgi:YrbI family 3-deoxy-D-manno-octulosonate 8-phosphate phosphatase